MRRARVDRRTTETQIQLALDLDGRGRYAVRTGVRFLDHMLELFARHGGFDLTIAATGDLDVDAHHTVEDVGIALGEAVAKALGDKRGINRAGYFVMPMDETLAVAAIDLSGRPFAVVDLSKVRAERVGDLPVELVQDFFEGFANAARANVHLKVLYGRSSHHQIEAVFKAFARALRVAVREGPAAGEDAAVDERTAVNVTGFAMTDRLDRLRRRQSDVGREGLPGRRRGRPHRRRARGPRRRVGAIVVPGVGHFAATASLDRGLARRRSARDSTRACRCSASASACSGCSTAATRRRACRASACCPAAASG